jgi:hypothetical protein
MGNSTLDGLLYFQVVNLRILGCFLLLVHIDSWTIGYQSLR